MSFVLNREDDKGVHLRTMLPIFFVLWLAVILSLVVLAFSLKRLLQESETRDVENMMDRYLAENPVSGPVDITRVKGGGEGLHGLAFLRLVKSGDQILLTESGATQVDFQQLAGLGPEVSGVWISLQNPNEYGSWTIVTRRVSSDTTLQGGKEDGRLQLLYRRIGRIFRLVAALGVIPAWFLALIWANTRVAPLRRMRADIDAIFSEGQVQAGKVLNAREGDGDLKDVYARLNRLLSHNRRLITEMQDSLDNVAHDLRTPMTRLRAVAEYALQPDTAPERLREALSDCLEESERVLSMLKIMMTVAEAESGTMHLQKEPVDLTASLLDVVSLYEYVAEEKRIAVAVDLLPALAIMADRTRMAQVWANMLDNAIKYGKEGGRVGISSRIDGEDAVVVFQDDGIGISKNELHRIWERLYRGDRSRSQPGLGLGLNYVRAVIEAHGGSVDVESELHKGTRLTVRLKCLQPGAATESTKPRSQISGA